jgi:hypothetical protein
MPLTMDELDGRYEITTKTNESGPHVLDGDGVTEVKNGLTWRKDKNGFIWESAFSITDDAVLMQSTLDPSHAPGGKFITDEKGNPTKSIMTYKTVMTVSRDGGRLTLSGDIRHGTTVTRVTMTRLS